MMKRITVFVLFTVIGSFAFAQSAKEMLAEMEGKWQLDDNGNVTVMRVVEAPGLSKDEIFNRALNYFVYNYGSGKSVIQTQDKEHGLVVGKGIYKEVHVGVSLLATYVDAWHILRVDAKEGRARVIVTLTDYETKTVGSGTTPPSFSSMSIAQAYPINPQGMQKTVMTKAFYKSFNKACSTLDEVEKSIKEGNTSEVIENGDW
ncbi:MAG: DUF4468 domain-containing protein [Mangrovibacterium sp.]